MQIKVNVNRIQYSSMDGSCFHFVCSFASPPDSLICLTILSIHRHTSIEFTGLWWSRFSLKCSDIVFKTAKAIVRSLQKRSSAMTVHKSIFFYREMKSFFKQIFYSKYKNAPHRPST